MSALGAGDVGDVERVAGGPGRSFEVAGNCALDVRYVQRTVAVGTCESSGDRDLQLRERGRGKGRGMKRVGRPGTVRSFVPLRIHRACKRLSSMHIFLTS